MSELSINPAWESLGQVHAVVTGTPHDYCVDGYRSPLSLKTVRRGIARYRVDRYERPVDASTALIINRGQSYDLRIDAVEPTHTLCFFFADRFVEAAGFDEDEFQVTVFPSEFPTHVFDKGHRIGGLMRSLERRLIIDPELEDIDANEDWLYEICLALMERRDTAHREIDHIPGSRPATRREVHRRLHIARDFMASRFDQPLDIASIAQECALSPHHFHRLHKIVFGVTPMTALRELRLLRARERLENSDESLADVCAGVGLKSLGSFASAFRRRYECTPAEWRAKKAGSKKNPAP